MNLLRLIYRPEDEWHGELFATVESEGFRGHGSAWFGIGQLREFCALAASFPIAEGEPPTLAGGYYDAKDHTLEQCHLGVWLSPHGSSGSIQVMVTVSAPVSTSGTAELDQSVTARFLVGYMDVERFRTSLEAMLGGQVDEAVLQATSS